MAAEDYIDLYDPSYDDQYEWDMNRRNNRKNRGIKKMTKGNHYMGSISAKQLGRSLNEAIQNAKDYLNEHPECTERHIVKIVKVVKRKSNPITVEEFRLK